MSAHGVLVALSLIGSLGQRRLVFFPFQDDDVVAAKKTCAMVSTLFGRFGLFGVESRYFDTMMIVRESVETILQSYQAYRMSLYVPRVWLNRLYVALLVLNCWMTPLVVIFFKRRPLACRLLHLLCGSLLDLMSSIGIPLILLPTYANDFDLNAGGLDMTRWYDDVWYISAFSELQLVFVSSWMDLFSRLVFYVGVIGGMKSMKDLLRPKTNKSGIKRVGPTLSPPTNNATPSAVLPSIPASENSAIVPTSQRVEPTPMDIHSFTPHRHLNATRLRRLKHIIHVGFVPWGLVVLILHLQAEQQEVLTNCLMQVRPWMTEKPACALLIMDCHQYGVSGYEKDIAPYWDHADEATVARILIRHCPRLHMPSILTAFSRLSAIKIYNSTVVEWGDEAALTNRHHPTIGKLLVLRSNLTDGKLPRGLLSSDFPLILKDIEFQISNLKSLPADLDTKWHSGSYLVFENCQFDHFPLVLLRLVPGAISLAFNWIATVPFEVFRVNGITHLNLAGNPISTLSKLAHETVVGAGSIVSLNLIRTNVSYLPRWIDPLFNRAGSSLSVLLCDSPFCLHRGELANGIRNHFPELDSMPLDHLSDVMSVTAAELITLDRKVSCAMTEIYYYPYGHDDALHSLPQG
ncbi:hypothetical protein Poli38472_008022 [Pythium oligandrum]|uniref:Leucine-rich repeat domain, L domain-like n=1 Tax=Pythium oligandrum TaxID=41045 RepID=A0A8K1CLC4_PYTOL|nr:hypothetical protein Poli38472_008022 [Pythium oligandrum]|eukprot:TMW65380.1 hypothetical protein Poli38472_008022 [Pythium oligandrum]